MSAALTCDCHVHVFDPRRYPYSPDRKFTPDTANVAQLDRYLIQADMARVVLVQPSVYGTDNRCLSDALGTLGMRARGVAVVAEDVSEDALQSLTGAGVVGARLNMVVHRSDDTSQALAAVRALDALLPAAWHIQLHVTLGVLAGMLPAIEGSRRQFVLDHLGLPEVSKGTDAPQWRALLAWLGTGQLHVKLSGPYLSSALAAPYPDLRPFVESLAQTRPQCLLWGSNWPHTQGVHRPASVDLRQVEPFRNEDPRAWPQACRQWLGPQLDAQLRQNAQLLYGFAPEDLAVSP